MMDEITLRQRLRLETAADHARVDELFSQFDLTGPVGLGEFLSVSYLAYDCLGEVLQPYDGMVPPAPPLEEILADLSGLGRPRLDWPQRPSLSGIHPLGVIYVIAGSHLGGTILHERWRASEDERVKGAGRFLTFLSDRACWSQFLRFLPSVDIGQIERNHVVESAKACFSLYETACRYVMKETAHGAKRP